jgi:hypothetical protein
MKIYKRTLLGEIRYYGFYIWWNWLELRPLKIKSFFQRGFRGWADEDTWDLDFYLATVISQSLKHLKYYSSINKKDLNIIIKGFEANLKMIDLNFAPNKKKIEILKLEFARGMKLFEKYFNYLWD